ncbi:MAG: hypothetical protein R3F65_28020 [bacterium]
MALSVVSPDEAAARLTQHLGADCGSREALCERVRAEVQAHGRTLRAQCIERVRRSLAPAVAVAGEVIAEVCDALVREGDITRGPGGVLHATPLRCVRLADHARLFGSLPTATLARALGAPVSTRGARRQVDAGDARPAAVEAIGGVCLTPEVWAGLAHAPRADAMFIARLDERLEWQAAEAGALDRDIGPGWRRWDPAGEAPRWRGDTGEGRLWRARTVYGGRRQAWTRGGSPTTAPFVELTSDEADRARFALTREAGGRCALVVERGPDVSWIEPSLWLPRPEYRWLALHAEPDPDPDRTARWRLAAAVETTITKLLGERLGLVAELR